MAPTLLIEKHTEYTKPQNYSTLGIGHNHQDHLDFVKHLINVYLLKKVYINS